ncbi:MAG: heavy-metal-associated domain-containing protein [Brevinematia bacterium]
MKYEINIQGMTCDGCLSSIRMIVQSISGVKIENISMGKLVVDSDSGLISKIVESIRLYGYKVKEVKEIV